MDPSFRKNIQIERAGRNFEGLQTAARHSVSGLAAVAIFSRPFRASCLPISASYAFGVNMEPESFQYSKALQLGDRTENLRQYQKQAA
jgi:hypothetical protein